MIDTLFKLFHLGGMLCGAYIGVKSGSFLQSYISSQPRIGPYITPFFKEKRNITEKTFYSLIGGGFGIIVGSYAWPITTALSICVYDPKDFDYLFNKLTKKK